jgi:hypothetical protein
MSIPNAKWIIPKMYTLDTREQCIDLLNNGYTLINNTGYIVTLDEDTGKQLMSNKNRKCSYDFSRPYFWQCIKSGHLDTPYHKAIVNTKSWLFKLDYMAQWLGLKIF